MKQIHYLLNKIKINFSFIIITTGVTPFDF